MGRDKNQKVKNKHRTTVVQTRMGVTGAQKRVNVNLNTVIGFQKKKMEKSEGEKINRRLRLYEQGQVSRARKKERDCKFYTVIRSQKEINKNGEKGNIK